MQTQPLATLATALAIVGLGTETAVHETVESVNENENNGDVAEENADTDADADSEVYVAANGAVTENAKKENRGRKPGSLNKSRNSIRTFVEKCPAMKKMPLTLNEKRKREKAEIQTLLAEKTADGSLLEALANGTAGTLVSDLMHETISEVLTLEGVQVKYGEDFAVTITRADAEAYFMAIFKASWTKAEGVDESKTNGIISYAPVEEIEMPEAEAEENTENEETNPVNSDEPATDEVDEETAA